MTAPITLPSLDELTLAELRRCYEETRDAETRTRYQMLVLSLRGQTSGQIAQSVLRSQDMVVRVLKRFLTGGLDAVPRRTAPARERWVTATWEAELLRVIELDPHAVEQDTANWTTERLAEYLGQQTGIQVTDDPDANRIEWLWRVSRRVVTHNHHRDTFELLLADVEQHFQALAQAPTEVLRHIGSPFASAKDQI